MPGSRLLALIGDVIGLLDLAEFHAGLLPALRSAVPADWVAVNDLAPRPEDTVVLVDPPLPAESHRIFARHAHENPLVARYLRTRDGRAHRFSDVATREALHATALYREFYAPIGLEHQIAFTLPAAPDRLLGLALSRREHDFTDAERTRLDDARPFLIQAYRNAIEHTRLRAELALRSRDRRLPLAEPSLAAALAARGVTARQAEVLSWVATGRSDRAVAEQLGLSERTVQKHLQGCFAKLGVRSRTDAVALAWAQVATSVPGGSRLGPPRVTS
jgi:DNA-binding CsgD family transcriptional regulator